MMRLGLRLTFEKNIEKRAFNQYLLLKKEGVMTILKTVDPKKATGLVAQIYEALEQNIGFVPNGFRVFSENEVILENQFRHLGYYMQHPRLSGEFLAFVRMLVSSNNSCRYCVNLNKALLIQYGYSSEVLQYVLKDPSTIPLPEKQKILLLLVLKVVNNAHDVDSVDVESVRSLGWTEEDILAAVYHGTSQIGVDAIFNAFNVEDDVIM